MILSEEMADFWAEGKPRASGDDPAHDRAVLFLKQ